MYSPEFSRRSRYFGRAIKRLYDELGNNLNLQMNNIEEMKLENTITFDMALDSLDKETDNDNLNVTKKEKKAMIKAALLRYLPILGLVILAFSVTMLLIFWWLH